MSNLSQFMGFREIPLIPDPNEPAFCTAGTGNPSVIYMYNHSCQYIGYINGASSEIATGYSWFSTNWSGQASSSAGWNYAGTTLASMHGHSYASAVPSIDTSTNYYSTAYYGTSGPNGGSFNGNCNSQITGVWVNKTKRDNLCLQRANAVTDYGSTFDTTQITTAGYGAIRCPITSTRAFNGVGANGYSTNRSYSLIGYNETTQMWVVGDLATSGASSLKVYKSVTPPTLANTNNQTFWDQFNHGTAITVNFTMPTVSDTHDYQHYKLFPLDNGNIAMVYKYASNSINYRLFVGNNGVNSTSWTMNGSNTSTVSTTTSYHDSNFTIVDALIAQVSYDGKYVFVYTQYYYYQSGICGFVIRVSDGQVRRIQYTDSGYCESVVMIQANKMAMNRSINTDGGAGNYLYEYDFEYLFSAYPTNDTDVTAVYNDARIDNPYTSTCYPMIWTTPSYLPNFIRGVF